MSIAGMECSRVQMSYALEIPKSDERHSTARGDRLSLPNMFKKLVTPPAIY